MKFIKQIFFFLLIAGCKNYSFTGASISPDLKSFSVQYFQNLALNVEPSLSQTFTEKLKEKFISQTSLVPVEGEADINFSGAITDYNTQPVAIIGTETSALTRLTINVQVKFVNSHDEKQNFEASFSRYADYDSQINLASVETSLIAEITDQLVDDIFNRAMINW